MTMLRVVVFSSGASCRWQQRASKVNDGTANRARTVQNDSENLLGKHVVRFWLFGCVRLKIDAPVLGAAHSGVELLAIGTSAPFPSMSNPA